MASSTLRWSVLEHGDLSGAENMAWDHTLARALSPGEAVLRLYTWRQPTLSLGRNEPARAIYRPERLREEKVDVVRRPTGGRAVLHHRELTYAVCAPIRALGGVRTAYATVNRALAAGLRLLGAPVELAGSVPVQAPDAGPCFQAPAEGEVMAAGGKLVGSAQVRMGRVLLQHGSILLADDQDRLRELRETPAPGPRPRPATLDAVLGRSVPLRELQAAVRAGFQQELAGHWRPQAGMDSLEGHGLPSRPSPVLLDQYASPEWTWRR